MINYTVLFELDGEKHRKPIEAINPGSAFFKILRRYPKAKLIECNWTGRLAGKSVMPIMSIHYDPPKNTDMPVKPKKTADQTLMPWG